MSVAEEVFYVKDKYESLSLKEIDIPEQDISDTKIRLSKVFEGAGIPDEEQKLYYSNKEEEMCYADRRTQLIAQMMRLRQLIGRAYSKQGFHTQAFYILRQSLVNFKGYAEGKHGKIAEGGTENEDKGSLKIPDMYNIGMVGGLIVGGGGPGG